jgi:hypothetical protein
MQSIYIKTVENIKILACIDNKYQEFKTKQEAYDAIKSVNKRILKNVELTPLEYKNFVESGVCMTLCNLLEGSKTRKSDNYKTSNAIGLDFDKGVSAEKLLNCLKLNGIDSVFFMNKTFSYTDEFPKYRIVIIFDRNVNRDERLEIYCAFKHLFTDCGIVADSIQDPTRILFGTNKKDFICYNPTHVLKTDLFLETYCNPSKVPTNSKHLDRVCKTSANKRTYDAHQIDIELGETPLFKGFDFDKATDNCKLFNDFVNLVRLPHQDLLLLATNLKCINGGAKLFTETLTKYNNTVKHTEDIPEYSNNNFNLIRICAYYDYKPMSLIYSPYEEDHCYKNLIDCVTSNRVEQIGDFETASIEENRITLNNIFDTVYDNCINGTAKKVNVIVSSTGTGKTQCIKKVANDKNVLYVMKTHKNIEDFVGEVLNEKGFSLLSTAKLPIFEDEVLNEKLKTLNKLKQFSLVRVELDLIATKSYKYISDNDVKLAKEYLYICDECVGYADTMVTTASKFSNINFKQKIAIIDECISSEYIKMDEIYFKNICEFSKNIKNNLVVKTIIDDIIEFVKNVDADKITSFKSVNADIVKQFYKTIIEDGINVLNLLDFIQADFIIVTNNDKHGLIISYGYKKAPKNSNMFKIIMTSTPDKDVLNAVYGADNIEYFILPETKIVGNLEQYNKHTYSKSSLVNPELGRVEFVKNNIDDSFNVITYMDCKHYFSDTNSCDFYFGFVEGHNDLKGQNLAVVGAMQPNPNFIKIKSALLGVSLHIINSDCTKVRKIEYNGFRFSYNTYENPKMKDVQLFYIYSQLNQSVGRARIGEFDANVFVFSSLPLKQAKFMQNKVR